MNRNRLSLLTFAVAVAGIADLAMTGRLFAVGPVPLEERFLLEA